MGYRPVVVVARGCGSLKLTSPQGFTGARTEDFHFAVDYIRSLYPLDIPMFAIGFSLGAGILLKYLGTHDNIPFTAAVAVSPPWNFHKTTSVFSIWSSLISNVLKLYFFRHSDMLSKRSDSSPSWLSI